MQRLKKLLQDAKGNPANVVIELEQQLKEKEEEWAQKCDNLTSNLKSEVKEQRERIESMTAQIESL